MIRIQRKRFDLKVTSALQTVTAKFQLDKNVHMVRALLLTSDREAQLYNRGTEKIEIGGWEHYPQEHECKLLMTSVNVPSAHKYYKIDRIPPGDGIIKVSYTDNPSTLSDFFTYRVSLYL